MYVSILAGASQAIPMIDQLYCVIFMNYYNGCKYNMHNLWVVHHEYQCTIIIMASRCPKQAMNAAVKKPNVVSANLVLRVSLVRNATSPPGVM